MGKVNTKKELKNTNLKSNFVLIFGIIVTIAAILPIAIFLNCQFCKNTGCELCVMGVYLINPIYFLLLIVTQVTMLVIAAGVVRDLKELPHVSKNHSISVKNTVGICLLLSPAAIFIIIRILSIF